MRIIYLIIISILFSACPRVRQNTQRFPAPNVFFTEDKDNRIILQAGYVSTTQKQELLNGSAELSKLDGYSNHLLLGSWYKPVPDFALGVVISPIKDLSFLSHYKIFRSKNINLYGGVQLSKDYGIQTAATFQNFSEKWFPFVSIKYRQVIRNFESFPDPGPDNFVHVREDIMDYQLGAQFRFDLFRPVHSFDIFDINNYKKVSGQIFIGTSQISKTEILSEDYPSNYRDELGFTYGVSIFNEF